jgi:hypothetical protein
MKRGEVSIVLRPFFSRKFSFIGFVSQLVYASLNFRLGAQVRDLLRRLAAEALDERLENSI